MLIPIDKRLHFVAGFVGALVAMIVTGGVVWGFGVAILLGVGKELSDMTDRENHTVDVWDAIATVAGFVPAYLIFTYLFQGNT